MKFMRTEVWKNKMSKKTLWIARTAVFTAALIVWQYATSFLNNTIITGAGVNLILILAVMSGGRAGGLTVAVLSPVFAKFFGIGPLWALIPFIALGNLTLVFVWHILGGRSTGKRRVNYLSAAVLAAVGKFLVLYIGVVRIAVPFLLRLPEKQAAVVSAMFSLPQFVTAGIGGVLAALILPAFLKAVKADG